MSASVRSTTFVRRAPVLCLCALSVAVLAVAVAVLPSLADYSSAHPNAPGRLKIIAGPAVLKGGFAQLERDPADSVPRLRVVTEGSVWVDSSDLDRMLDIFQTALDRKKPFMVIWDVRKFLIPRVKREPIRKVRDWVEVNVRPWDRYVQAHAIILSNPLQRMFAHLLLRVFLPPQPIEIVRDEEGAHAFARSCCTTPRSFVKKVYAGGEQRYKLLGVSL